jgi:hypothetical protein
MKIEQRLWTKETGWQSISQEKLPGIPQLVLVFGGRVFMEDEKVFKEIKSFYPKSHIIECSTAGEILDTKVRDNSIVVTAIYFEKTRVEVAQTNIVDIEDSLAAGKRLAGMLSKKDLVHAMVFSDGLQVNGTSLVKGLNDNLPPQVSVTGGLVGDGPDFKKTVVGLDHVAEKLKIVLVGFYSSSLKIGYGSFGGWDAFGIERMITKSKGNVLYELDGKPALELYKTYLGDKAEGLPSTGLLFPLRLRVNEDKNVEVVRTILGVDEKTQSMTFAGDMPEGSQVALMKANFNRLVDGASTAGNLSVEALGSMQPELAILISCIGRKLVLKERVEEEVEAVKEVFGGTVLAGFYSYGELCPSAPTEKQCRLHNQTMTITTFREE